VHQRLSVRAGFTRYDADPGEADNREVRLQGRHFMDSVMALLGVVAIQALIFSRIVRLRLTTPVRANTIANTRRAGHILMAFISVL
jgi:hypothetical protein